MTRKFKEMQLPDYLSIDWTSAKKGTAIELNKEELGKNGLEYVMKQAKQNKVELHKVTTDVSIILYVLTEYKKEELPHEIILSDLLQRTDGVTWSVMQRTFPYSQHKPKDLKEIMTYLKDQGKAYDEPYFDGKKGRPTVMWRPVIKRVSMYDDLKPYKPT